MWFRLLLCFILFAAILLLFAVELAPQNPDSPSIADARKLYESGNYDDARKLLESILDREKGAAEAYFLLSGIELHEGTVRSRTEAEKHITEAIRLSPDSISYHFALIDIYQAQGFRRKAYELLEKLTEKFPGNPEVFLRLGIYYKENSERMYDTVTGIQTSLLNKKFFDQLDKYGTGSALLRGEKERDESGLNRLEEFKIKERKKAWESFLTVKMLDPRFKDVDRQMAIVAYHTGNWNLMKQCAGEFLQASPDERDAHLFMGLAHQRSGEYAKAMSEFNAFSGKLLPDEKKYFESFDPFLSGEQQETIAALSEPDKAAFHSIFWTSRDPLFLTEYNERLLEHYARVAEAQLLFSAPDHDIEGWKTDRGLIWIRYGPPRNRTKNFNNFNIGRSLSEWMTPDARLVPRSRADEFVQEFWYYDIGMFMFYELPVYSGKFYFLDEGHRKEGGDLSTSEFARRLQKEKPDMFDMKVPGKKIEFPRSYAAFRGAEGRTRLHMYHGIPLKSFHFAQAGDKNAARFRQGIFIFDEKWNPLVRESWNTNFKCPDSAMRRPEELFATQNRIELPPGTYNLAIEFKDDSSGNFGASRDRIILEEYGNKMLQLSDILLASRIEPKPLAASSSLNKLDYEPNIPHIYRQADKIFLYFEIYNLWMDGQPGKTKFQMEYSVRHKKSLNEKEWTAGSILGRLFSFSRNRFELATMAEFDGIDSQENMFLEIAPASLEEGIYELTVVVTDRLRNARAEKKTAFYIAVSTHP